ncbi:hypothetical protein GUJ93_ZPchr0004g38899 [Zizania palustris]|uniref:Alpha-L-fucosidase n=1 Tax=Zizania palustris TaxID=103762 RepID=A0A8J5SRF0_ZIZPA|nr:hypothetical protein GUJ93_ZPchr0004g38899 [Zizania palustris]
MTDLNSFSMKYHVVIMYFIFTLAFTSHLIILQPALCWIWRLLSYDEREVCMLLMNALLFKIKLSTYLDANFIIRYSRSGDRFGQDWVPAECDVSIRPGWFWHASEKPKNATTLLDIYYKSVGRNCLLILNVPPNSSGLISAEDMQVLQEFTEIRQTIFSQNFAANATVTASTVRGGLGNPQFAPSNVLQESIYSYWAPEEGQTSWEMLFDLRQSTSFNVLQLQEPIQMGQRTIKFHVEILVDELWQTIVEGTTIGYKRLLQFPVVEGQFLKLSVDSARADPLISFFGIFIDPFSVTYSLENHDKPFLVNSEVIMLRTDHSSGNKSTATM